MAVWKRNGKRKRRAFQPFYNSAPKRLVKHETLGPPAMETCLCKNSVSVRSDQKFRTIQLLSSAHTVSSVLSNFRNGHKPKPVKQHLCHCHFNFTNIPTLILSNFVMSWDQLLDVYADFSKECNLIKR